MRERSVEETSERGPAEAIPDHGVGARFLRPIGLFADTVSRKALDGLVAVADLPRGRWWLWPITFALLPFCLPLIVVASLARAVAVVLALLEPRRATPPELEGPGGPGEPPGQPG